MNTTTKVLLATVVGIGLLGLTVMFGFLGVNNQCVAHESSIKAQYTQNQNNYDNYFKKLKEVAQVPSRYIVDLKSVYDSLMQGRRGSENELFRMIKEANPNVDSSLYRQIQQVIESGRNDFESNQKSLIDKKRVYEVYIGQQPNKMIAGFFGYPTIDLNKYDIVTSDVTQEAFKTKRTDPISVF